MPTLQEIDAEIAALEAELGAASKPIIKQTRVKNPAKSAIIGAGQGMSAGFGDELIAGLTTFGVGAAKPFMRLAGYSENELPNDSYDTKLQELRQGNQQAFEDAPVAYTAGAIGGSIAGAGKLAAPLAATNIGSKIAGATLPTAAGRLIAGTAKVAAPAAASGYVAGFGSGEGGLENRMAQAEDDAILSAALGVGLKGAKEIIAPSVNSAIKPLAKRAKDLGIPLSVNQVSPSRARNTVQKLSQGLPFSGVKGFEEKQIAQWNKAVAKTLGVDANDLSPAVINQFVDSNSQMFNSVLQGKNIKVSEDIVDGLTGILSDAQQSVPDDLYKVINNNVDFLLRNIDSNGVSGEKIASLRSSLMKNASNAPREAKQIIGELIDLIDDDVGKNLSKADVEKLGKARREYRNFKTIEPLLEKSTDGNINPTQLMQRVASSKYIRSSRKNVGDDDLVDLARIGKQFLPKVGGSDTVPNLLIGGGIGTGAANPATIAPIAGTVAANRGYQSLYNQAQPVVNRLVDGVGNVPALAIGAGVAAQPNNQAQQPMSLQDIDAEILQLESELQNNQPAFDTPNNPDGVSPQQEPLTLDITPQSYNTQMPVDDFTQQNEGVRLSAYPDPITKKPLIGYGLDFSSGIAQKAWKEAGVQVPYKLAKAGKASISQQDAINLYRVSKKVAENDAREYFPDYDRLTPKQQTALIDMSYQMGGNTLKEFTGLKKALKLNNKNAIIKSIRTSKYYNQTPDRADRVLNMLITEE